MQTSMQAQEDKESGWIHFWWDTFSRKLIGMMFPLNYYDHIEEVLEFKLQKIIYYMKEEVMNIFTGEWHDWK